MKYIYLTLIICLFVNFGFAQTTAISDTNFEQFLIDESIDTNGLNGNILNSDAQAVTALNITINTITDFTGLEAFINVTELKLGKNQFSTLPLTGLIKLELLEFKNNDALNTLDFTQNIALKTLYVGSWIGGAGNGVEAPILSLDLSQNILLEKLYLWFLKNMGTLTLPETSTLTEIDIFQIAEPDLNFSKLDGLDDLYISGSTSTTPVTITLPDVKTVLTRIYLSGINIINIDVSEYIMLETLGLFSTDFETWVLPSTNTLKNITVWGHKINSPITMSMVPELTHLDIRHNYGTTPLQIDVTTNLALTNLSLTTDKMLNIDVSKNLNLTNLDVSNNDLTTLDVTKNTLLKRLRAGYNQLSTIDLSKNLVLESLTLSKNLFPSLDVTLNTKLKSLSINDNLFTGTGLDLTQNPELNYLNAEKNQIESLDITQNLKLLTIILNYNLFPGTAILDQFYNIRLGDNGLRGGSLEVSHNLLTGTFPNFFDMVHLGPGSDWTRNFQLTFDNNYFHFGDFEDQHLGYVGLLTTYTTPGHPWPVFRKYEYAPQAKVNTIENIVKNAGESITMTTTVRGTQNHYKWFKDGVEITDAEDAFQYIITDLNTCDIGVYHCEITSDLVPFENSSPPGTGGKNLLLVRNDITLGVNATKSCVALVNPLNNATNVPINTGIEWDDNPGACGYKLSVGSISGGTDIVNNEDVGEITLYNFANNLPANSDIFVTITPYFDDGDFTPCTEEKFRTSAIAVVPDCTLLTNPINNATDIAIDTDLTWNPANSADSYRITIGTTSGGTEILAATNVGNVTFYDLTLDLPENTTIYVKIIPYNAFGNAMGCIIESFTTETIITRPNCSSLTLPTNGLSNVSVGTNLNWTTIVEAEGYFLSVGDTPNTTNIITKTDLGNITNYNFLNDLPSNTTIYVTIIPYNSAGDAIGCVKENFTTEIITTTIPDCTTITTPTNGAVNVSIATDISWDAIANADDYILTIGTSSGANDIANERVTGTTYDIPTDLVGNTTYYVSVIPKNGVGQATGCTEISFTTETIATVPNCTTVTTPTNGAINVSIATNISWDAIANADDYILTIGTSSGANDIANETIIGTSYDIPTNLAEDTTYYVLVIPQNSVGLASGCTEISFTTETIATAPTCTTITAPTNGAINVGITTDINWDAIANADDYLLTIGTSSGANDIVNETIIGTSYDIPTNLAENTTYYVSVIPQNSVGQATGCTEISFTTEEPVFIEKTKYGFSPDGDGINETWQIVGIEQYPNNIVYIFNRWGDLVFQTNNYNNTSNVFRGDANRLSGLGAGKLPEGTYFFRIAISQTHNLKKTEGFLVLKR